jgi:hypothetical protein
MKSQVECRMMLRVGKQLGVDKLIIVDCMRNEGDLLRYIKVLRRIKELIIDKNFDYMKLSLVKLIIKSSNIEELAKVIELKEHTEHCKMGLKDPIDIVVQPF